MHILGLPSQPEIKEIVTFFNGAIIIMLIKLFSIKIQ